MSFQSKLLIWVFSASIATSVVVVTSLIHYLGCIEGSNEEVKKHLSELVEAQQKDKKDAIETLETIQFQQTMLIKLRDEKESLEEKVKTLRKENELLRKKLAEKTKAPIKNDSGIEQKIDQYNSESSLFIKLDTDLLLQTYAASAFTQELAASLNPHRGKENEQSR